MINNLGRNLFFFLAVVAVALFCFDICEAESIVKVIAVKGSPKITKVNTTSQVDCKTGLAIDDGDRIVTAGGDAVEIAFTDDLSNVIKISENSDVYIRKGQEPYKIELLNGEIMALVKKLSPDSSFEIKTPAGLSGARGTGWGSGTNGRNATFSAFENSIYTRGIDPNGNPMEGELIVGEGFKALMNRFEKPGKLEALTGGDRDRWNKWKEDFAGRNKGAGLSKEKASGGGSGNLGSGALDKADRMDKMRNNERALDRMGDRLDDRGENKNINNRDSGSRSCPGTPKIERKG